jgi:hypothetical protein
VRITSLAPFTQNAMLLRRAEHGLSTTTANVHQYAVAAWSRRIDANKEYVRAT